MTILQELKRLPQLAINVIIIREPRAGGRQADLKQFLVMRDNDQTAAHAVILCAVVIGSGIITIIAFRAADARRGDVSGFEGREHAAQFGQHGFKPCFCVGRFLRLAGGKAFLC